MTDRSGHVPVMTDETRGSGNRFIDPKLNVSIKIWRIKKEEAHLKFVCLGENNILLLLYLDIDCAHKSILIP